MVEDNDVFIFLDESIDQENKNKKDCKIKTTLDNQRLDIEELSELNELNISDDVRSDVFTGRELNDRQKRELHNKNKVYVRSHTKVINGKVIAVKPYIRKK